MHLASCMQIKGRVHELGGLHPIQMGRHWSYCLHTSSTHARCHTLCTYQYHNSVKTGTKTCLQIYFAIRKKILCCILFAILDSSLSPGMLLLYAYNTVANTEVPTLHCRMPKFCVFFHCIHVILNLVILFSFLVLILGHQLSPPAQPVPCPLKVHCQPVKLPYQTMIDGQV